MEERHHCRRWRRPGGGLRRQWKTEAAVTGFISGAWGCGLRWIGRHAGVPLYPAAVIGAGLGLGVVLRGLRELGSLTFLLPRRRRQVPGDWWLYMGTRRASLAWGGVLGAGFFTFAEYPIYYLVCALALAGYLLALSPGAAGRWL